MKHYVTTFFKCLVSVTLTMATCLFLKHFLYIGKVRSEQRWSQQSVIHVINMLFKHGIRTFNEDLNIITEI